jgi:hypothetical protein
MGKMLEELERVHSEIFIIKERLKEKSQIPKTRKATVCTLNPPESIIMKQKRK